MATPALSHWDVKVGDTSMEEMRGACFAGSASPFRGRERAAVDIDVCPERRSPRYHEMVDVQKGAFLTSIGSRGFLKPNSRPR